MFGLGAILCAANLRLSNMTVYGEQQNCEEKAEVKNFLTRGNMNAF